MAAIPHLVPGRLRSLAEAGPGDILEIVNVLFGCLRQRYEGEGIRVGTKMLLLARTPDLILVQTADGRRVEIEAVHAHFVEVRQLVSDEAWRPGGIGARHARGPLSMPPLPSHLPGGRLAANPQIA